MGLHAHRQFIELTHCLDLSDETVSLWFSPMNSQTTTFRGALASLSSYFLNEWLTLVVFIHFHIIQWILLIVLMSRSFISAKSAEYIVSIPRVTWFKFQLYLRYSFLMRLIIVLTIVAIGFLTMVSQVSYDRIIMYLMSIHLTWSDPCHESVSLSICRSFFHKHAYVIRYK